MNEELHNIITSLRTKIQGLEKRIELLEGHKIKPITVDISSFPNPEVEFINWIKSLVLTQDNLSLVFAQGYIQGVSMILCEFIEQDTSCPIKPNTGKKNQFYVFHNQKWQQLDNDTFDKARLIIESKLFKLFKVWKDNNPKYLTDEYCDIYSKYHHNVMGSKLTKSAILHRVRIALYLAIA